MSRAEKIVGWIVVVAGIAACAYVLIAGFLAMTSSVCVDVDGTGACAFAIPFLRPRRWECFDLSDGIAVRTFRSKLVASIYARRNGLDFERIGFGWDASRDHELAQTETRFLDRVPASVVVVAILVGIPAILAAIIFLSTLCPHHSAIVASFALPFLRIDRETFAVGDRLTLSREYCDDDEIPSVRTITAIPNPTMDAGSADWCLNPDAIAIVTDARMSGDLGTYNLSEAWSAHETHSCLERVPFGAMTETARDTVRRLTRDSVDATVTEIEDDTDTGSALVRIAFGPNQDTGTIIDARTGDRVRAYNGDDTSLRADVAAARAGIDPDDPVAMHPAIVGAISAYVRNGYRVATVKRMTDGTLVWHLTNPGYPAPVLIRAKAAVPFLDHVARLDISIVDTF